jgi:NTP pyrophosphatase (non-canonical NTP hydrolase)
VTRGDSSSPDPLAFLFEVPAALGPVQAGFDAYQRACFPARPPEFFALELNGEAGELANDEKKAWTGREVPAERFVDEAADVFIALMNYCNARGIDLGPAVAHKMRQIEQIRRERRGE